MFAVCVATGQPMQGTGIGGGCWCVSVLCTLVSCSNGRRGAWQLIEKMCLMGSEIMWP
jgi:hypothetical protein